MGWTYFKSKHLVTTQINKTSFRSLIKSDKNGACITDSQIYRTGVFT